MRKNVTFLSKVAHHSYVDGLKMTGVSIDEIPDMYGMNRILKEIGWAAAAVDGFIPPAAFMEFQAYNVLVIAVDIRTLDHIEYTPAPDIIHEAAGHAPIIANPEYSEYLRRLGEIGSKAISSKHDWDVYDAVRKLSQLKEQEEPDERAIAAAQRKVDELQSKDVPASEMSIIRNLQWWTVEYGLIGSLDDYKIYGAGLLSSIGESIWCLKDNVEKIPYSIDAAEVEFDITRPQPKLFVTPNFAYLSKVLEEFAERMALRKGGVVGVEMLIDSQSIGTIELSTGLQITGVFDKVKSYNGKVSYISTTGLTSLAYRNKELIGHSTLEYQEGFITPLGKLKGINLAIEDMSPLDLETYGIYEGKELSLKYEGGIEVLGRVVTGTRNLQGKIMLISLTNCTVRDAQEVLFESKDNMFHLAVGKKVVSAFAGLSDVYAFDLRDHELSPSFKNKNKSQVIIDKENTYQDVRDIRFKAEFNMGIIKKLEAYVHGYPKEWLLLLEILELTGKFNGDKLEMEILDLLGEIKRNKNELVDLIDSGIQMYHS
ncbi:phenylalanine 4-monooxygenase [Portibacter lacus]|uniref:Phenylalanine 4-monooxygenase n=2 Tax=Portibacter lacus TaxID=1099794 RepID=A0AA37STB2_9BACT|nr:phenylalanine 4-monooxygenase [Portibacter lacus]